MTLLICPIEPHEMDKAMLKGFEDMVRRVVLLEADRGWGKDLLLRVFLAGVHCGHVATERRAARLHGPKQAPAPEDT